MSGVELVVVAVAAVVTAAITAVAGAGGGLILLIVILQFVDPLVAIPVHGVVQLVSNGTRALSLRDVVETSVFRWYFPLLVPATIVGYLIADGIPRGSGRAVVGCFALIATWWPAATAWLAPKASAGRRFALVGAVAGLINPTVGAPGPLLAPAFRSVTSDHVHFVGTFSVAQSCNHLVKVAVFGAAGFAWSEHWRLITVAAAGVIIGTRVGARYLRGADPAVLGRLFKVVVTAGAARLIVDLVV